MKNKIYTIRILNTFSNLQDSVDEFQKKLPENEEIVSTAINSEWLVVTVRVIEENKKNRNLLLEEVIREVKKGQ